MPLDTRTKVTLSQRDLRVVRSAAALAHLRVAPFIREVVCAVAEAVVAKKKVLLKREKESTGK